MLASIFGLFFKKTKLNINRNTKFMFLGTLAIGPPTAYAIINAIGVKLHAIQLQKKIL